MLPVQLHGAMRLSRPSSSRHTRHVIAPPSAPDWLVGDSAGKGEPPCNGFSMATDSDSSAPCASVYATEHAMWARCSLDEQQWFAAAPARGLMDRVAAVHQLVVVPQNHNVAPLMLALEQRNVSGVTAPSGRPGSVGETVRALCGAVDSAHGNHGAFMTSG